MTRAACTVALLLAAACATPGSRDAWKVVRSDDYLESVAVALDTSDWKVSNQFADETMNNIEFVRSHEQIESWTELVTLQTFLGISTQVSAEQAMLAQRDEFAGSCPVIQWAVVHGRATDVTYEWHHSGCDGHPPQHELSRLVTGVTGIHRISYVKKVPRLDDASRAAWLTRIQAARIAHRRIDELRREAERP